MVRIVAFLLLIAAVLIAVIAAGRWCLRQLTSDDRFQIALVDVDCDVPPGMTKTAFLGEVKYCSGPRGLPDRFPIADAAVREQVREAFQKHPRVLSVDEIEATPPAKLRVKLKFK